MDILDLKNIITDIKNSVSGLNNRLDTTEKRISQLNGQWKNAQKEAQREKIKTQRRA